MKVKVRGLVFVGFAAAVFATSAMADAASDTADKKTVTSKYYVDQTFQTKDNIVTVEEAATAANWTSETTYPSMAVLKDVRDTLNAIDVTDDNNYVSVTEGTGNSVGTFTVALDGNKIDTTGTDIQASTTTNDGNLVTAGAVKAFAQDKRKIDAATGDGSTTPYATTITASSANDTYPTSQNVYKFVTGAISTAGADYQRKLDSNETALYVGKYDSNDSTWKALEAVDDAHPQATKEYVTIATGTGGVYQINLLDSVIGYNGTTTTGPNAHDSDITSSSDKLATGKAVYEFVTDAISTAGEGYQPVVSSADTVVIGYQATGGDSGWKTLTGDGSYVNVAYNGTTGNAEVSLTNIGADADVYGTSTSNDTKLATAGSVRKLLDTSLSNATTGNDVETNNTVPTSRAVVDYVASFGLSSTLPSECRTANSDHVCALVAYYDTTTSAVKYEWTVMAPTGN